MDCTKFHEIISLYVDEETSSVQAQALEKHLESCPNCKAYLSNQLKLRDMLKDAYVKSEEVDLSASIMGKINQPKAVKKSFNLKRLSVFAAAAAAVCVLAMAALMSLHIDNNTVAGNEKLEEYIIEHVGSGADDFNGKLEAVNVEK